MNHNVKKPRAKALRFTKIPKNKQNEKKAKSLIKKANKYSKSVNTIANSVYDEKEQPKINDMMKTKTVEAKANEPTTRNLERINYFLLKPSIKFCFNVP